MPGADSDVLQVRNVTPVVFSQTRQKVPKIRASGGASLNVGIARTCFELEQAFRLVKQRYRQKGYDGNSRSPLWLNPHDALPQTRTFIAKRLGNVVATLTLVVDEGLGLPMDGQFSQQLSPLRSAGLRLAEVTSLAVADTLGRDGLRLVLELFQRLGLYLRHEAPVDRLCITVNPRHRAYYEKKLGFSTSLGVEESYKRVAGAPAAGLVGSATAIVDRVLSMPMSTAMKDQELRLIRRTEQRHPFRWNFGCFRYFFVDQTALLGKLNNEFRDQLRIQYPDFDWAALLPAKMLFPA
jgi:hypothetical protein